mgnify:CR=1 FL=1
MRSPESSSLISPRRFMHASSSNSFTIATENGSWSTFGSFFSGFEVEPRFDSLCEAKVGCDSGRDGADDDDDDRGGVVVGAFGDDEEAFSFSLFFLLYDLIPSCTVYSLSSTVTRMGALR